MPPRATLPVEEQWQRVFHRALKTLARALALFALLILVCSAGYVALGWPPFDALYMTVITVFGVGFGEVMPVKSVAARLWTMGVIFAGYAALVATISTLIESLSSGQLHDALLQFRRATRLKRMENHIIICGYGRVGQALSQELEDQGHDFVIIDRNPSALERAKDDGHTVLCADATSGQTLEDAGLERAACLAIVLPDDALNVFIALTASEMLQGREPRPKIIARGERPSVETKLLHAGADHVIMPARLGGQRIAALIQHKQ